MAYFITRIPLKFQSSYPRIMYYHRRNFVEAAHKKLHTTTYLEKLLLKDVKRVLMPVKYNFKLRIFWN